MHPLRGRRGAGRRSPRRASLVDGFEDGGVIVVRQVGGEQVGEHYRAGQVGDTLVADNPAALGLPYHHVVVFCAAVASCLPLPNKPGASSTLPAVTLKAGNAVTPDGAATREAAGLAVSW